MLKIVMFTFTKTMATVLIASAAVLFTVPASAQGVGKSIVTAPFGGPSRNALPSDQEEMSQRELCARRNLQNYGVATGDCKPAAMPSPKTGSWASPSTRPCASSLQTNC